MDVLGKLPLKLLAYAVKQNRCFRRLATLAVMRCLEFKKKLLVRKTATIFSNI